MVTSTSDCTVVRFSSGALPENGRALEELHERGLLPTRFIRYGNAAARVDLVNRTMPGLRILTASYASVRREGVRQEGDLLYLCLTLTGTTVGSRGGRLNVGMHVSLQEIEDLGHVLFVALLRLGNITTPCARIPDLHAMV